MEFSSDRESCSPLSRLSGHPFCFQFLLTQALFLPLPLAPEGCSSGQRPVVAVMRGFQLAEINFLLLSSSSPFPVHWKLLLYTCNCIRASLVLPSYLDFLHGLPRVFPPPPFASLPLSLARTEKPQPSLGRGKLLFLSVNESLDGFKVLDTLLRWHDFPLRNSLFSPRRGSLSSGERVLSFLPSQSSPPCSSP